jgi:elongation factor G
MGVQQLDGRSVVTAHIPLAECQRYATDLRSISQGRGTFSMRFDHYEDVPAHLVEEVKANFKAEQAKEA